MIGTNFIKTYKSIPLQVRASLWFFICSVLQKVISVIATAVFTRVMTTEDYGLVSIYNSWADILLMIAALNLNVGCFNVGMTKYDKNREVWVSSLQVLSLLSASVFVIVFLGTYKLWGAVVGLSFFLCVVMAITFFFNPAINLWVAKQRYTNSYRQLVIMTLSFSILNLVLPLIFVFCSNHKGEAKIIASAVAIILCGSFLLFCNFRDAKKISQKIYDKSFCKFAFKYNIQMMPAFLSTSFMCQIDRIMIDRMIGREEAAIYSVAYNVAFMISIVSSAINATFNPWMMQNIKKQNFSRTSEVGVAISIFLLFIIEAFIFFAPEVVYILAPAEYYKAIYIIPSVAGSVFFTLIYTLYCPIAQFKLKVMRLTFVNVLAGSLNVVLNYYAISKWGYLAAGYTTFISYFIYGVGTALSCAGLLQCVELYKLYDLRIISTLIIILTATIIFMPILYNGIFLRYLLLLGVTVFFVIKRKELINLLRVLRG